MGNDETLKGLSQHEKERILALRQMRKGSCRRCVVDDMQDELFDANDVNGLLDFVSHLRNPMHTFYAGYMPPAFSKTGKLNGAELYDALSRLEYRTRNSRNTAGLRTKLVFPGKGGWACGRCRDLETELNPNECMNVNCRDSFVVIAQIGYAIWPAVVGVCVGYRGAEDVKALAGIADYSCQPGLCKTAVERDAGGIGQDIINRHARELSGMLNLL